MAEPLEVLEELQTGFTKYKEKSEKQLTAMKKEADDQIKKLEEDHTKALTEAKTEWATQVKEANALAIAQGLTIKQLQDEVGEIKAKKGRILTPANMEFNDTISNLKKAFEEHGEKIAHQATRPKATFEFDVKDAGTMTIASNLTGNGVATYNLTPAVRPRRKLHFRDLVSVIPTSTGIWKFYRQNKPTGEGSFLTQSPGALKSQVDYDLTEVTINADYLAGYVRIAKQMLQDLPFMQNFVSEELVEDYLIAEDYKFFQQLIAASNGNSAGVVSSVTAERIIQAIAALNEDSYDPNGIVVTNAVWAKILNTKPNDYSLPGGSSVTVDANGNVAIVGVPLFKTVATNIGENRMVIGDWTRAKIIQTEGLSVNMYEQDQDNVVRNLITIKAEARVAMAQLRTDAFLWTLAGTT